jgi:hypothetical protein
MSLRRLLVGAILLTWGLVPACSTTPREPERADSSDFRPLEFRAEHPPFGSIEIENIRDRRPAFELGTENYLNDSYYSEELFRRPVVTMLRGLTLRELVSSGLFTRAASAEEADYLLRIELRHFYAKSDRDLFGLIPVLPTIEVEGRVVAQVFLTDQDGRRFLDKRYDLKRVTGTATVGNVPGTGADLLLEVLEELMTQLLRDADSSVLKFWRELGRDPINPLPDV